MQAPNPESLVFLNQVVSVSATTKYIPPTTTKKKKGGKSSQIPTSFSCLQLFANMELFLTRFLFFSGWSDLKQIGDAKVPRGVHHHHCQVKAPGESQEVLLLVLLPLRSSHHRCVVVVMSHQHNSGEKKHRMTLMMLMMIMMMNMNMNMLCSNGQSTILNKQ